jgi:CRISPR/Cas system-associated exonuclease Cas4 (RecB family)
MPAGRKPSPRPASTKSKTEKIAKATPWGCYIVFMASLERYNHSLVIAPREEWDGFLALKAADPHLDLKLLSLEDLRDLFAYSFDERAVVFLLEKGYEYPLAKDMLSALKYLKKESYSSKKLNALVPVRDELAKAGLLYLTPNPERTFQGRQVLIHDYDNYEAINDLLCEVPNLAVGPDLEEEKPISPQTLHHFTDIYEELHYIANRVAHLILKEKVDPAKIALVGLDENYDGLLEEFASRYGFTVEPHRPARLLDTPVARAFLERFESQGLVNETLEDLAASFGSSPDFASVYKIAKRFDLASFGVGQKAALYEAIFKTERAHEDRYEHAVQVASSFYPVPTVHYFLLNFAMGVYPPVAREEGYLSDAEKKELGLMTSKETNALRNHSLKLLFQKGLIEAVTFKDKAFGNLYFKAAAVKTLGIKDLKVPAEEAANDYLPYEHAAHNAALLEASFLDEERNFLHTDPRLGQYKKLREGGTYLSYDHAYVTVKATLKDPLIHYYSDLKKYFGCPFEYYVEKVLGVKDDLDIFSGRIGDVFHTVMENLYEPAFDFEKAYEAAVKKEEASRGPYKAKEKVFLTGRLKAECQEVVSYYQSHEAAIPSFKCETEKDFSLVDGGVSLGGRIDKLVTFGKPTTYLVVLDYKTGIERFDEELFQYGLSLQLPFYAAVARTIEGYEGLPFAGLFIGPLLSPTLVKPFLKAADSFLNSKYKLTGVYTNDTDVLVQLDKDFHQSSFIRGLAYSDDSGFYWSAPKNVRSEASFEEMAQKALAKAREADAAIKADQFLIAPKVYVKKAFDACQYCAYRDICYRKDEDVVHLPLGAAPADEEDADEETEEGDGDEN